MHLLLGQGRIIFAFELYFHTFNRQLRSTSSPVVFFGVFQRVLFELLVHLPVEVVPQEEGPEPEQRVHLLRLADPQPFPLWKDIDSVVRGAQREKNASRPQCNRRLTGQRTVKAPSAVLVVSLLGEAVVPQQLMGWMPEFGQGLGGAAVTSRQQGSF